MGGEKLTLFETPIKTDPIFFVIHVLFIIFIITIIFIYGSSCFIWALLRREALRLRMPTSQISPFLISQITSSTEFGISFHSRIQKKIIRFIIKIIYLKRDNRDSDSSFEWRGNAFYECFIFFILRFKLSPQVTLHHRVGKSQILCHI